MLVETSGAGAPFPHCGAAHGASGGPRAGPEKRCERVTGNRGRGQENQNIKLSVWTTLKNSTVLGVSEHAESIGIWLLAEL